jgi:hypothetical protein
MNCEESRRHRSIADASRASLIATAETQGRPQTAKRQRSGLLPLGLRRLPDASGRSLNLLARLKAFNLHRQRGRLPDENLCRLAKLVLAAAVVGEADAKIAIAPCDKAPAVDASNK